MRLECAGGSLVFADTSTTLFRGMIVLIDKSLNMNPSPEEQEPLVESDCEPIGNENGLSSVMSALIVLKGVFTTGFLTIPLSIALAGFIPSVLAFIFAACLFIVCYIKLYEVRLKSRGDYLDVMEHALGKRGRILATIFILLTHLAVVISETSFILDNLPKILALHTEQPVHKVFIAIPVFIVIGLLSQFRQLKTLRYFYSLGVIFTLGIVLMIIIISITRIASNGVADTSLFIVSKRSPTIIGIAVFSFDFSPVILNVAINMKQPAKFPSVVRITYIMAFFLMMSSAFLPYLAFGGHQISKYQYISEAILEVYSYWYIQAIISLVSIGLIGSTIIFTVPLFYSVESFFFPSYHQSYQSELQRLRENQLPSSQNAENLFGKIGKYRTLIRTLLIIGAALGALFLSNVVNRFISVSEILLSMPLVSILPVFAHQKLVSRSKQQSVLNYLLIGVTVVLMIVTLVLLF